MGRELFQLKSQDVEEAGEAEIAMARVSEEELRKPVTAGAQTEEKLWEGIRRAPRASNVDSLIYSFIYPLINRVFKYLPWVTPMNLLLPNPLIPSAASPAIMFIFVISFPGHS